MFLSATRRVVLRCQADLGGEIATRFKRLRRRSLHAEHGRPDRSDTGIVERRQLTSSWRYHFASLVSISSRRASTAAYFPTWNWKSSRAIVGKVSSSSTRLMSALTFCLPAFPTMPNSAA